MLGLGGEEQWWRESLGAFAPKREEKEDGVEEEELVGVVLRRSSDEVSGEFLGDFMEEL